MAAVPLITLIACLVLGGVFGLGYYLGVARRPSDRTLARREHARLVRLADKAHRHERYGLAAIYNESAARVMKELEP